MSQDAKIKLTVLSVPEIGEITPFPLELTYDGPCPYYKVGQEITLKGQEKPDGFCEIAWNRLVPFIKKLKRGEDYDFIKERGKIVALCPDAARPVSFLIERI